MRLMLTLFCAAGLLCGCASNWPSGGGSVTYLHDDWLYHYYDWYDDDFWIWVDDHPECWDDQDDIKEALQEWYGGLDPGQQQAVRDRVQTWMDEQAVVPAAGQSSKDLVLETASERWTALTPAERQQWLDQRRARIEQRRATGSASSLTSDQRAALGECAADLSPEQRAALRESAQGISFRPGLRPRHGRRGPPLDQQSPDSQPCWSVRRHALPGRTRRRSRGTGTWPIVLPRASSGHPRCCGIVIEMERLTGETHARYLPMPSAEVRRWSKLEHDLRPHWPVAALHREPMLLAPARRYPIRKATTPVPVAGGVAGGALPMSAGTSFHGRRKPN
jgi:hypothetical protein